MILYGTPVWFKDLMASRSSTAVLLGLQRRLATRITQGYRTISCEAALAVSRSIPWDLLAGMYAFI